MNKTKKSLNYLLITYGGIPYTIQGVKSFGKKATEEGYTIKEIITFLESGNK